MKITIRTKSGKKIETTLDVIKNAKITRESSRDDLYCDDDPEIEIFGGELVFREPTKWETVSYDIGGNHDIAIQSECGCGAEVFADSEPVSEIVADGEKITAQEFVDLLISAGIEVPDWESVPDYDDDIADYARDFLEDQPFWRLRHNPMRGFANEFENTLFLSEGSDNESCGEIVENLDEAAKLIALSITADYAGTEVVE